MRNFVLCIGAAKAGTTWLYEQIAEDKAFFTTPEKELHYFHSLFGGFDRLTPARRMRRVRALLRSRANEIGTATNLAKTRSDLRDLQEEIEWYRRYLRTKLNGDWYRALFARSEPEQICFDFSPSTALVSDDGVKAIKDTCGNAKLIYLLRDPVDRLWSHVKFHAEFCKEFDEVMSFDFRKLKAYIERNGIIEQSLYGRNLEKFYRVFQPKDILLVDYSWISERPAEVQMQLEEFLMVPFQKPLDSTARVNAGKSSSAPREFLEFYRDYFLNDVERLSKLGCGFAGQWLEKWNAR